MAASLQLTATASIQLQTATWDAPLVTSLTAVPLAETR
jgi:hypothetical protein